MARYDPRDYIIDNEIAVDFVGAFEKIKEDFQHVAYKVGLPMYAMPVVRATVHEHYSHYYDDEAIDKVVQCAAWDIDFSEYTYDECK